MIVGEIARRNQLMLESKRLNETLRLIASTYEEHLGYVEEFNAYCADNPEVCEGEPTQENAGP